MSSPGTPALRMLWETGDPAAVVLERFGFRDAGAAGRWVAGALHAHWGVEVRRCEQIVMSDRNALAWVDTSAGRRVAKWSVDPDRFGRLAALARLTAWLGTRGLPVSAPVAADDGRLQVEVDGTSLGLQRVVDGALLDVGDLRQVHAAGAALARLHDALAAYPDAAGIPGLQDAPRSLAARVTGWLDTASVSVPPAARDRLRQLVADGPGDLPPAQLVHGDVRSANVLCADGRVAAVLDFEEARSDHRVVELARSAVLLGTRFRGWGPVSADVRARLLAGYRSHRPLTATEEAWWDALVLWSSLAMVPPGDDPTGWGAAALGQLPSTT